MTFSLYSPTHRPRVRTPLKLQLQAQAKLKLAESGLDVSPFLEYRFDPDRYMREKLGWEPWGGTPEHPGQKELNAAYTLALRQQFERQKYDAGETYDATIWQSGQVIQNWIRGEAGHTVGKTKDASGLVNHFLDCFAPAIIYTFAPTWSQVKHLLWKEIKTDRKRAQGLPGRVLENCEIKIADNHFAQGRAAGKEAGTEGVQGQHGPFLMFVLDEAEGIHDFVFDAIDSMASGGIVIVLLLANPRTQTSRFHRIGDLPHTANLTISCLYHPNVLADREIVPGAVRRDYVTTMVEKHCEVVGEHSADDHTFELPWQPGTILRPDAEFMFRVLGQAPANTTDKTMVPVGRYKAAVKRGTTAARSTATSARMGLDVARFGKDFGKLYVRRGMNVWCADSFAQDDTNVYARGVKRVALALAADGVTSLHIRIDGGGGFGGGVADKLNEDLELQRAFAELLIIEVHFGVPAHDEEAYADCITELYAEAAESLKGLALIDPPNALMADLCERTYDWKNDRGRDVKKLDDKKKFRRDMKRSPDDGDGFVLAVASDFLFDLPFIDEPPPSESWSTYL